MKTWTPRETLLTDMMAPMTDARVRALGAETPEPPPVPPRPLIDWLATLCLLYGVPFDYLVADAQMLPTESLRFFYVDQNWLNRLIDGALSVAIQSSREAVFNETFYEAVYAAVQKRVVEMRPSLRNTPPNAAAPLDGTRTGLLFRSVVVSGWPGLEINATAAGVPVEILRRERLSSEVMLVLVNGVPDLVVVVEPGEGLHFGLIGQDTTPRSYQVLLRGLGFAGYPGGEQIMKDGLYLKASTTCRSGAGQPEGVVDIATLTANIKSNLPSGALGPDNVLTPGGGAIQLVRGAGLQSFTVDAVKDCTRIQARSDR